MTLEYLLVDDQFKRSSVFEKQVRVPGKLEFMTVHDPADLAAMPDEDVQAFDGVIADFHLHPSTSPCYTPLRCANPTDPTRLVDVRTGMGVMLYVKQHTAGMPLFGLTELTHRHAPLFLTAAQLWLDAEPLNINEEPAVLRQVLLSRGARVDLQATYQQMSDALQPFIDLMDSCLTRRPREAYDWLRCFRTTSGSKAHVQLRAEMRRRFGPVTKLDPDRTYAPIMDSWQRALREFVAAWGADTSHWPTLPDKPTAKTWKGHNPVLEYISQDEYGTFFNAPEVRAALSYYRAQTDE